MVRRVRSSGETKWQGSKVYLIEALISEPVGLVPKDDRYLGICFSAPADRGPGHLYQKGAAHTHSSVTYIRGLSVTYLPGCPPPDLLILDELGLHRFTAQQSADPYELILNRPRVSSFVITSNRSVDEWLGLFEDPVLAKAPWTSWPTPATISSERAPATRNASLHTGPSCL